MPLRTRVALLVAAAVTALVVPGGALFVDRLRVGLDASLDATLRARADALVQAVGPDGAADFQDSGPSGVLPPGEALAQVVNSAGRIADFSHAAGPQPLLRPAELSRSRAGPWVVVRRGVRLLAVPVPSTGKPPTVVVVGTATAFRDAAVSRVRTQVVVAGIVAVSVCTAGAWLLAGGVLRPVERMRREAAEISASDSAARLPVPTTRDEVARLGATVNELLARLQRALARQRDFVADAGHELRTPLTILRAELELADQPTRSRAELRTAVRRAAEETDRLIRLAEDLLLLARADGGGVFLRRAPVALHTVAGEAARAAAGRAADRDVRVSLVATPVVVEGDEARLRQVLDNLLENAVRFAPRGTSVVVRLDPTPEGVVLEVLDSGPGFPEDFLPHAFERFRRADPARSAGEGGAGLGLAIVASLVTAHGGAVSAANRASGGACVRISLPGRHVSAHS